ncbi:MAG: hypothetical protein U0973_09925, partial [Xanthomonadaceae bacterium]|nr:hypothetical protein [Xanthomonadaceae bacterium]
AWHLEEPTLWATERRDGGTGAARVAKRPTERSDGGTGAARVAKRPTERSVRAKPRVTAKRSTAGRAQQ